MLLLSLKYRTHWIFWPPWGKDEVVTKSNKSLIGSVAVKVEMEVGKTVTKSIKSHIRESQKPISIVMSELMLKSQKYKSR